MEEDVGRPDKRKKTSVAHGRLQVPKKWRLQEGFGQKKD